MAVDFDEELAKTTLDDLVHAQREVVSFRHLSSELRIPTTVSKAVLRQYTASNADCLSVVWAVTASPKAQASDDPSATAPDKNGISGRHLIALVTAPYPGPKTYNGHPVSSCTVWAIAAKKSSPPPGAAALWTAADRTRDFELAKAPPGVVNELRDNRWSSYVSKTAGWNTAGVEDHPTPAPSARTDNTSAKPPTSLRAKMKTEASAKRSREDDSKPKASPAELFAKAENNQEKTQTRPIRMGMVHRRASTVPAKAKPATDSKSKPKKARNPPGPKIKPPSRKVRRIVDDDDDDDDDDDNDDFAAAQGGRTQDQAAEQELHDAEDSDGSAEEAEAALLEREAMADEEAERERAEWGSQLPDQELHSSAKQKVNTAEGDPEHLLEPSSSAADRRTSRRSSEADNTTMSGDKDQVDSPPEKETKSSDSDKYYTGNITTKEIKEMVEDEKGYYSEKTVLRYFDDNGDEISEDRLPPSHRSVAVRRTSAAQREASENDANAKQTGGSRDTALSSRGKPSDSLGVRSGSQGRPASSRRNSMKPSQAISKKGTKKANGDITSFFAKK